MLQIDGGQAGEEALLHLDDDARRGLSCVLADWLNMYAGMDVSVLRREYLELVVEVRRLLLSPDERVGGAPAGRPAVWDGAAGSSTTGCSRGGRSGRSRRTS
jgi:hypothetical protein